MRASIIMAVIIVLYCVRLFAQSSFETYLNDSFDQTIITIKEKLVSKKYEEKEIKNLNTLTCYDWTHPFSISVDYIFKKDGTQLNRILTNGKENENDAEKSFALLKEILIKKHDSNYTETSMLGVTLLMWKGESNLSIMLIRKGDSAKLTMMKI